MTENMIGAIVVCGVVVAFFILLGFKEWLDARSEQQKRDQEKWLRSIESPPIGYMTEAGLQALKETGGGAIFNIPGRMGAGAIPLFSMNKMKGIK
jgi:hypothetical protein